MAKKNKKTTENETKPVENTSEVNETPIENETESPVENESGEESVEEITEEPTVEPEVEVTPEVVNEVTPEPEVAPQEFSSRFNTEEVVEVAPKENKNALSPRKIFEQAIQTTPFSIMQNGILICHHSDYLKISIEEKYFEINFKKYSYEGIEIKYI